MSLDSKLVVYVVVATALIVGIGSAYVWWQGQPIPIFPIVILAIVAAVGTWTVRRVG